MELLSRASLPDASVAALFQLVLTLAVAALCAVLHRRYRKPYFGLWAAAWVLYGVRVAVVFSAPVPAPRPWASAIWVVTGWSALGLLWAALVFTQRLRWRAAYAGVAAVPVVWAAVAVHGLGRVGWSHLPMVLFVSGATAAASLAFVKYDRTVRSGAARLLAAVFGVWAVVRLFDPSLLAPGSLGSWSPYLDIFLQLTAAWGIVLLVLEDLEHGLHTLTALSGEVHGRSATEESISEAMLRRALSLRGVHGSALWLREGETGRFVEGAGIAALWPFEAPPESAVAGAVDACATGTPRVVGGEAGEDGGLHVYMAALPVLREETVVGALVIAGEARDPFTVLDNGFLLAFGQQVGSALANEELNAALVARTSELERLQERMVHQHEEERSRLWRELHDETAQVLAALSLQLGVIEERSSDDLASALDRAKNLLGEGIKSIRSVTRDLRPTPIDDMGLVNALRALARDFDDSERMRVTFDGPEDLPGWPAAAEVALYRTLQEALSNTVRHGSATRVSVELRTREDVVELIITDDGEGFPPDLERRLRGRGGTARLA